MLNLNFNTEFTNIGQRSNKTRNSLSNQTNYQDNFQHRTLPKHWSAFTLNVLAANPSDVSFIIIFCVYFVGQFILQILAAVHRGCRGLGLWPWHWLACLTGSPRQNWRWPKGGKMRKNACLRHLCHAAIWRVNRPLTGEVRVDCFSLYYFFIMTLLRNLGNTEVRINSLYLQ